MLIKPSEIAAVERIGTLDGSEVKLVKTQGGLFLAVGRPRGRNQEEVLAAGSHPAIVKYNIEKHFTTFTPALAKSEAHISEEVTGLTELLPASMRAGGYDFYSLEKNASTEFVLTKHGSEIVSYSGSLKDDSLILSSASAPFEKEAKGVAQAVVLAAARKASKEGKDFVVHKGVKFDTRKLVK